MNRGDESDPGPTEAEVLFRDDGRVRIVTFNRPDRVNAFTSTAYRRLARVLNEADTARDVSVVLMQGSGRGFSSGVDLASAARQDPALGETFDGLIESLIQFSKPLLAAVHGAAVGFGATILLHCDMVLVSDTARLRYPFTALGTAPEAGSSELLPRLVGLQRAADLLLTSRWISGAEAAEIGLATRCCREESLQAEALATARALTELPDAALVAAKRLLKAGVGTAVRGALGRERAEVRTLHDRARPDGLPRRTLRRSTAPHPS